MIPLPSCSQLNSRHDFFLSKMREIDLLLRYFFVCEQTVQEWNVAVPYL